MKMKSINHQDITRRDAMKGGVGAASVAALGIGCSRSILREMI